MSPTESFIHGLDEKVCDTTCMGKSVFTHLSSQ